MKRKHNPTSAFLKKEIKRRKSDLKGYAHKKIADLLAILQGDDFKLPEDNLTYLKREFEKYKTACEAQIGETDAAANAAAADARNPNITIDDRLQLIEAMLYDEAKTKLRSTQECSNQQQLDARKSSEAVVDYFQMVSDIFNNEEWTPELKAIDGLHEELDVSRLLPLGEYRTTKGRVKDKYDEMKNRLHGMYFIVDNKPIHSI